MQQWEVFSMEVPNRLEHCDPKKNNGLKLREVPPQPVVVDALSLCEDGKRRRLDWMCRSMAATVDEHERLYGDTDAVRVFELFGYRKAADIAERIAHNQETLRTVG